MNPCCLALCGSRRYVNTVREKEEGAKPFIKKKKWKENSSVG
jgi:hypothetical protein